MKDFSVKKLKEMLGDDNYQLQQFLKQITMGTWGFRNFENDTASDWVFYFEENSTIKVIEKTINKVIDEENYLNADDIARSASRQ